jgi:germination protein M
VHRLALVAFVALLLAGCGGHTVSVTMPAPTATVAKPPQTITLRAYFLRDGKVAPVGVVVPKTLAVAAAATSALVAGTNDPRLTNAVPATKSFQVSSAGDTVTAHLPVELSHEALAQVVYTLTQFPSIHTAVVNGTSYTRADFEDVTPTILVESPLPEETVRSPLHATGTANTFEATFDYDLVGPDGTVLAHHFVTATSGSGTRGTFDFTAPFTPEQSGPGKLVVYEISAADGSRIHQVEVPIRIGS